MAYILLFSFSKNRIFTAFHGGHFVFFLSLTLIIQACVIYQKKEFWELYNIGLAFVY